MPSSGEHHDHSDRTQTNDSLRAEREKTDHAFAERLATINAAADAAIQRARARAREVLERARRRADDVLTSSSRSALRRAECARALAEQVLQAEQLDADAKLAVQLAPPAPPLVPEREDTDSSLQTERFRSDAVLARRDEVLGSVSHELRNMLHSMIGFAELIELEMAGRSAEEEQVVVQARFIQRSGARMDRLIGDLVDVASIESGVLTLRRVLADPMLIVTEALEVFEEQAAASGISLVVEQPATLSLGFCDPARVLQVLVNLLSNALKFTPRRGRVAVRVECSAGQLRFAVSDTGVGIQADQLESVFERFWQVTHGDHRGVGLGLYISKRIVLAHGGRIWAESKVGAGTTFYVELPRADLSGAQPDSSGGV